MLVGLSIAALTLLMLASCDEGDSEDPLPPDNRLVGNWRDKAAGDNSYTDEWSLDNSVAGNATRTRIDRGLQFTDATPDTIVYNGNTYNRTTGADGSISGDFEYDEPLGAGTRTNRLTLLAGVYGHDLDTGQSFELIEQSGTFSAVGNAIDLTRSDTGTVWTNDDHTKFELMTSGAERWHY
ncbi:MAG: hypothetical protein AB7S36_23525, partial [Planctomycetota bacterium]